MLPGEKNAVAPEGSPDTLSLSGLGYAAPPPELKFRAKLAGVAAVTVCVGVEELEPEEEPAEIENPDVTVKVAFAAPAA